MIYEHPDYDYCNCKDAWEHTQVIRRIGIARDDDQSTQAKDLEIMSNQPEPAEQQAPQNPISELLHSALAMHEMFLTLKEAGFTEYQALVMIAQMIKGGTDK